MATTTETATTNTITIWKDRKHFMWFPFSFTKYEVKDDRLFIQRGLFNTTFDETLLYRITDLSLSRSFGQKIFGTGTITLCTKGDHDKHIPLINIKKPLEVKKLLSDVVEDARDKKHVIGNEFFGGRGRVFDRDGDGDIDQDDFL